MLASFSASKTAQLPAYKTFRHELKYYINFFEYHSLAMRLSAILKLDPHASKSGDYHIRSLYFDDVGSNALSDKQAGILSRKKYRIRIYNISSEIIRLERKERIGQFIRKYSAPLSLNEYNLLLQGNFDFLLNKDEELCQFFYKDIRCHGMKPSVIVDYVREAYISDINNIRITFDKNLRTGLTSTDLFNKKLAMVSAIDEPLMVLEIKYDNFLPDYIKNILQLNSQQRYAISKYVICKKMIKLNSWEDH